MRGKAFRRGGAGGLVLAAIVSLVLLLPLGSSAQTDQQQCEQADPEHPLELNTVEAGKLFKTVAMEKEVFNCFDDNSGQVARVVDLETFIEIIEQPVNNAVRPVEKRVEVTRCVKDFRTGRVDCKARDVPLEPVEQGILANCTLSRERVQPRDPVEMNTIASSNFRVVKTIKLDKEVFDCGQFVGDFYLFTEIIEAPANVAGLSTLRPVAKQFEAILCLKEARERQDIERCLQIKM